MAKLALSHTKAKSKVSSSAIAKAKAKEQLARTKWRQALVKIRDLRQAMKVRVAELKQEFAEKLQAVEQRAIAKAHAKLHKRAAKESGELSQTGALNRGRSQRKRLQQTAAVKGQRTQLVRRSVPANDKIKAKKRGRPRLAKRK